MLSLSEVMEMTSECVEGAMLLSDEECAFVHGMSVQLASGVGCTTDQAERIKQIYTRMQGRSYL